jgi:hypothetical protein
MNLKAIVLLLSILAIPSYETVGVHVTSHLKVRGYPFLIPHGEALGLYWDQPCTQPVASIDWGVVNVSEAVSKKVWIKNLAPLKIAVTKVETWNWSSSNARLHTDFWFDYGPGFFSVYEVRVATLNLNITQLEEDFSFDITVWTVAAPYFDFNGDGTVNRPDLAILAASYGANYTQSNFNMACDLNFDGTINLSDLVLFANHYGEVV